MITITVNSKLNPSDCWDDDADGYDISANFEISEDATLMTAFDAFVKATILEGYSEASFIRVFKDWLDNRIIDANFISECKEIKANGYKDEDN